MIKLAVLSGLVMLGITTTSQEENNPISFENDLKITHVILTEEIGNTSIADLDKSVWIAPKLVSKINTSPSELELNEIDFIEENSDYDLGFDTKAYLPKDFDPTVAYFDVDSVVFLEDDSADFGFNTSEYLPNTFDPYAYPTDISGFNFIEEEDEDLGFETASYLPNNFNAHEFYFDLDSVEYIEEEEELDLDYNAEYYLPSAMSTPCSK